MMLIFGHHPVLEALESEVVSVRRILITRGKSGKRLQKIIDRAREARVPLYFENTEVLNRKAGVKTHQGVIAELSAIPYTDIDELLEDKPPLLLLLDGVEDPRNLGAVFRTAEAVGVNGILLPQRGSCGITPTVVKASAGGALHVRICSVVNMVRAMTRLKKEGYWLVGLDLAGEEIMNQIDTTSPLAVVVGGEQRGLRRLVREHCDYLVRIPMVGKLSSLNLSVAAGILLYSISQQRLTNLPSAQ